MAEFSKEYCESHNMGFDGDFSIIEEYNKLEEGNYISLICEGYGFLGILKQENECKLIFEDDNKELQLVPLEELETEYKKYL